MWETLKYDGIIQNFIGYANQSENIRAAMIVGSRARKETPADDYSDLDLVIFAKNPERLLYETDWLSEIGEYHITFIEDQANGNGKERRVMFYDALDVDFPILPIVDINEMLKDKSTMKIIMNGVKILLDKDDILTGIDRLHLEKEPEKTPELSETEFDNMMNDFWYHCIWSTKKLLRGEYWTAKMCVDRYMKNILLRMIEVYSAEDGKEIWYNGRFIEHWTKPEIIKLLDDCFAHYNKKDILHALKGTMNLFSVISRKNAQKLNYEYPQKAEDFVHDWMKEQVF